MRNLDNYTMVCKGKQTYYSYYNTIAKTKSWLIKHFPITFAMCGLTFFFITTLIFYSPLKFVELFSIGTIYFIPIYMIGGKEVVVPMLVTRSFHPFFSALFISFIDFSVGIWTINNFDKIKEVKKFNINKRIIKVENKTENFLKKHEALSNLSFIGIILFVMIPIKGTGGFTGAVLGRMSGLSKYTIALAIGLGSLLGCLIIAYSTEAILRLLGF